MALRVERRADALSNERTAETAQILDSKLVNDIPGVAGRYAADAYQLTAAGNYSPEFQPSNRHRRIVRPRLFAEIRPVLVRAGVSKTRNLSAWL